MTAVYRTFFGLTREPFPADMDLGDIYQTSDLSGVLGRFEYAVRLGGMALVTGDIGAGKSNRPQICRLHPSSIPIPYLLPDRFFRLHFGILPASALWKWAWTAPAIPKPSWLA